MSARADHAARVMAGTSEAMCWKALFDEIDLLRGDVLWLTSRLDAVDLPYPLSSAGHRAVSLI